MSKRFPPAKPARLPVYGEVPEFSLMERSGRTVQQSEMLGKVWIADFIFTRCAGPCPLMSLQMAQLQEALSGTSDVCLATFTVDPEVDTPDRLSEYADRYGAKRDRWWFLTGKKEAIYRLVSRGFHLGVQDNAPGERASDEGPILHSTRFVLVDRKLQIRGYYDSADTEAQKKLLADTKTLLNEKNL